ncbi:SWI/SNF and RSC complex subunit Ssr2 [Schizosaccharomyces cryophilus OY26]|uniref:SWI/SNF and RSC complex subunit Ssr2 n=1 Tax=Schizosaccharomyces cryophilus (strain OY26 / ATCC MYA-4695 / CBS 11777 / NBRC 106824 / NRRL Y48691) TaxID=653667 RepID=S9XFI2_SCHCR|nr:SWI/SNF and RSC complex subunit Ssr2 [Schizosaccharomyces cryophilus OY26]EPY52376.1 SWI/SNF and RSC complex subunit Ssr2 [Schizosaccharomyces cryophilus OY26]
MSSATVPAPFVVEQMHPIIVPSYAGWFDMSKIHDIERKSNPEFFNGKSPLKNPSVYKEYRDFMINTYRLEPTEYLTVTACRRNLVGDVCAIIRVHAFLEQWGLINYQVDPETRPPFRLPPVSGHVQAINNTPILTQEILSQHAPKKSENEKPTPDFLKVEERVYDAREGKLEVKDASLENDPQSALLLHKTCYSCGVDCSQAWYHNLKNKEYTICPHCYHQGRFANTYTSSDFLFMEGVTFAHDRDAPWTEQETLLLLEGIEEYDDDWNQIALHVGTRTKEQCLVHFLRLPIEDPYKEVQQPDYGPFKHGFLPFKETENPVLSTLTFLASIVQQQSKQNQSTDISTEKCSEASETKNEESDLPSSNALETAARAALNAAGEKSRIIASCERRHLRRLVFLLIQSQLEKVEIKMKVLEELEKFSSLELSEIDVRAKKLILERLSTKKMLLEFDSKLRDARNIAGEEGLRILDDMMNTEHAEVPLTFELPDTGNISPLSAENFEKYHAISL